SCSPEASPGGPMPRWCSWVRCCGSRARRFGCSATVLVRRPLPRREVLTPCPPLPSGEGERKVVSSLPSPEGRGDQGVRTTRERGNEACVESQGGGPNGRGNQQGGPPQVGSP